MNYLSTRDKSLNFSFKEIFLRGLAPGGGLFLPSEILSYDKSNLENLGATFNYGAEKIYGSMGKDAAALVKRSIDINPHSFYNVILQSTNREAKKNSNGYNFLKINYSNVMGDVAEFDNLQKNVWGNFVSKEMNKNNGSQVLWTTARKVSPNGNGYNWNYSLLIDSNRFLNNFFNKLIVICWYIKPVNEIQNV